MSVDVFPQCVNFSGSPVDMFHSMTRLKCDHISVRTDHCFYSEPIPDSTFEKIKTAYCSATNDMGRYYSLKGIRLYNATVEGHKDKQVLIKSTFCVLVGGYRKQ